MAAKKIANIANELLQVGADPETKIMLVESDKNMLQHWQISDLKKAAANQCRKKTTGPGIIYISKTIDVFAHWQIALNRQERIVSNERLLPLFFDLKGQRILLVGAGRVAFEKLEKLLRTEGRSYHHRP